MDYAKLAIDEESRARLAERGLVLELIDTNDGPAFRHWLEVEARGFHESRQSPEKLAEVASALASRRTTAVFDMRTVTRASTRAQVAVDTAVDTAGITQGNSRAAIDTASAPIRDIVATVNSWPVDLTVPGSRPVEAWAISGVTVAATHRRRGIARALLESELRTAHRLGIGLAALTVSEATIYGRFGFAPAARSVDLAIDTRRAKWIVRDAPGRLHFVSAEELLADADAIFDRVRVTTPGSVTTWPGFHEQMFQSTPGTADRGKKYRFVRYDDQDAKPQGYAAFQLSHDADEFDAGVLTVEQLVAATPQAYAALWRFMVDMDLVATVKAPLRSVDEPLFWQVADMRGVRSSAVRDHLWIRILDVESALSARLYSAPAHIVLDITDDLGFGSGIFDLHVNESGAAKVTRRTAVADAEAETNVDVVGMHADAHLALPIAALGAIYLGGIRATTLAAAGVVSELLPGSAATVDRAFASASTPWLSIWF